MVVGIAIDFVEVDSVQSLKMPFIGKLVVVDQHFDVQAVQIVHIDKRLALLSFNREDVFDLGQLSGISIALNVEHLAVVQSCGPLVDGEQYARVVICFRCKNA
jgi:hypothetical protein